jgi:hypothetical protein|tara:strand:- start:80 stop:406 length:327 start_codon:yes stop_codon:yes gene_type:complete
MQRYLYNNRVKNTTVHKDTPHEGKLGYDTTIMPAITRKPGDPVIITTSIDRLDLLANRFYKDVTMWWVIALANNLPGDSFFLEAGLQIFIPKNISKIVSDLKTKNEIR